MPSLNKFCQTFLQSSRSLATGLGSYQPGGEDRSQGTIASINTLLLTPNPSSGTVVVQRLDSAVADLRVWDTFGRLVLSASNTEYFDTVSWQSGIYFVESIGIDGQRASGRLVVEHP